MKNQIDGNIKKERVRKLLDLSKGQEISYMNKHLNNTLFFIPEVYKDGYLIGHSENYLLIKCKGNKEDLRKNIKVFIKSVNYPYLLCDKTSK